MSTDRRTFIKYASAMFGGSMLAACGVQDTPLAERQDASDLGVMQTPNGFRFYTLKRDGDSLPNGHTLDHVRFDAVISDNGKIAYAAFDEEGRVGLYALTVDTSGERPTILQEETLVRELDAIPGGQATPIGGYHVGEDGAVVFAVETFTGESVPNEDLEKYLTVDEFHADGIALDGPDALDPNRTYIRDDGIYQADASGIRRIVAPETVTSAGHVIAGGFGPAILRGRELMFTATVRYHNDDTSFYEMGQGFFYVGDVTAGAESAILVQRTGLLPDGQHAAEEVTTESIVQRFGLFDFQQGGTYCLQAHTALPSRMQTETEDTDDPMYMGTLLMVGNALRPGSATVLSVPYDVGIQAANVRDAIGFGEASHGPRLSPNGKMGAVLTLANEAQRLYYGGTLVLSSGDVTPTGQIIESFMTPTFGPAGEMYVMAMTDDGQELMMFDGVDVRTILRSYDTLVGETTPVAMITMGTLIRHVNRDTHLVFTVVREDGTSSLVLGVPA